MARIPRRATRREVKARIAWLDETPREEVREALVTDLETAMDSLSSTRRVQLIVQLLEQRLYYASIESLVGLRSRTQFRRFPRLLHVLTWYDTHGLRAVLRRSAATQRSETGSRGSAPPPRAAARR